MYSEMGQESSQSSTGFTGAEQVAALLLAIDRSQAAKVLRRLEPEELREITRAMAKLDRVQPTLLETLIEQFSVEFSAGSQIRGSSEVAELLLSEALPPNQAAEVMSQALDGAKGDVWGPLAHLPEDTVVNFLINEHPHIVSLALSKLEPGYASKVATLLPRDKRNNALRQILSIGSLQPAAAEIIDATIREELLASAQGNSREESHARMASILNTLDSEEIDEVMQGLNEANPKEAASVRKLLFSFNDLPRLSKRALAVVLDKTPSDLLMKALRGTDSEFRDAVLSTMASRSRRLVESEIEKGAPLPPKDVNKARKDLAALVLDLSRRGEIEMELADAPNGAEGAAA